MGMKQILLMIAAVVGLSVTADEVVITDPAIKAMLGRKFKKPYGEFAPPMKLTVVELERVTYLDFSFSKTPITDESLKDVAKLQNLEELNLRSTDITDAGLKGVAKLQKLTKLNLEYTQITDEGLKDVAKLQKLGYLNLKFTRITDEGLQDVAKLKNLATLFLSTTPKSPTSGLQGCGQVAEPYGLK